MTFDYRHDPRPDLAGDSAVWTALLHQVANNHDLLGTLHATRCAGTCLRYRHDVNTWVMVPRIDQDNWPSQAAYNTFKSQYLVPAYQRIAEALRQLPAPEADVS